MGYSHFWYTKQCIPDDAFLSLLHDVKQIYKPLLDMGVLLSSPSGVGDPIFNENVIEFNGTDQCGHMSKNVFLHWPTSDVQKVSKNMKEDNYPTMRNIKMNARICGGSCMHEPFIFRKINLKVESNERLPSFNSCKTSFKPYDMAVNVVLIIVKHYLNNDIWINSDGAITQWNDAMMFVNHFLGYGRDFILDEKLHV